MAQDDECGRRGLLVRICHLQASSSGRLTRPPSPSLACRYNEATDETSWDRPEGVADTEWAEARHVESDDVYYVNTKTQETSWDKPAELQ